MDHGSQPSPTTLAALHRQGLVTHVLSPPDGGVVWSIDPQTVRDLDGLALLVICADGTVAVACPDGLPPALDGMATLLDGIGPRIDAGGLPGADAAQAEGGAIAAAQPAESQDAALALLARLGGIAADLRGIADAATARDARSTAAQTSLAAAIKALGQTGHGGIAQVLARLDLHAAAARQDTAEVRGTVEDVVGRLTARQREEAAGVEAALGVVRDGLDTLLQRPALQVDEIKALHDMVAGVARQVDGPDGAEGVTLQDRLQGLQAVLSAQAEPMQAITGMKATLEALLRAQTTPEGDDNGAVAVRQHLVRQGLVQSQILRRLDAVAQMLAGRVRRGGAESRAAGCGSGRVADPHRRTGRRGEAVDCGVHRAETPAGRAGHRPGDPAIRWVGGLRRWQVGRRGGCSSRRGGRQRAGAAAAG